MPFDDEGFLNRSADATLAVLRAARVGIASPDKWCQGQEVDHFGRRCAVGWLDVAVRGWPIATHEIVRVLLASLPGWPLGVVAYNDAEGRTQAEMVALFDAAIARVEADDARDP